MKLKIFTLLLLFAMQAKAQTSDILKIYTRDGQQIAYDDFTKQVGSADIVLFGEMHNCPVTHWMEKRLTASLFALHGSDFVLGAEMFESDNQLIMNEHLQGIITGERFEAEARLWPNYTTDYMPLVDFAKEHNIPFIATNIPRRYARTVSKKGLAKMEALVNAQAKRYIAPLPIPYESDSTQSSFFGIMSSSMGHSKRNPEFMAQAQAVKDATMAWFIAQNTKGKHFLHFNGSYHSDSDSGIRFYLKKYIPNASVTTISSARQSDIESLGKENLGRADFIIVVGEDFPFSY